MEIKDVKLVTHHEYPDENGDKIPVLVPHFLVTTGEGEVSVPFDPMNMDYLAIKDWYGEQKNPGFKFDFDKNQPG